MEQLKNTLLVRCHKCGMIFKSPVAGNINSLIESALINIKLSCPKCGLSFLTSKPDYFYIDDDNVEQTISFKGGYNG